MKPLRPLKLRNQVLDELMGEIEKMTPGNNRLPAEDELARKFHVSRATIREALGELAGDGYITRRQGKGNYGHPSSMRLQRRIDLAGDFFNLLGTPGKPVPCEVVRIGYSPIPPAMRKYFPSNQDRAFEQFWLYGGAENPLILCKNYVPADLLLCPPQPPEPSQTLIGWISAYCNKDSAFYAVHMGCLAEKEANWILGVEENAVVQNWHETVYDINDDPVAFCDLFFHPVNADLSMILFS